MGLGPYPIIGMIGIGDLTISTLHAPVQYTPYAILCSNFHFGQGDTRAVPDQTILYETFAVSHFLGRRHLNTNAGRASGHLLLIYTCLVGTIATKLLCSSTANFGRLLPLPSIPVFSFYDKLDSRNLMEAAAVRRILPCLSKDNIGYTHCTDALSLANNLPLH